ncbi:MAG: FMN-binding protein [Lachnospiraceae bacterium]|nr:FMN-binding protein [Lachnospiraceae bacterium]
MAGKEKAALQLYNDGVYSASADGFGGIIKTEVIINNGNIEEVNIVEAENEDKAYLKMAIAVINDIIEKQSADVDTISGATYSSTGILNSVEKALSKAKG